MQDTDFDSESFVNLDYCSRIFPNALRTSPCALVALHGRFKHGRLRYFLSLPHGARVSMSLAFGKLRRAVIRLLPAKKAILKRGALLRPRFRRKVLFRIFSAMADSCPDLPSGFLTNLGIDKRLRIHVSSADLTAVFGAPRFNIAERSSLELALALFRESDCFVDVGSYLGLYVFYLRARSRNPKPIYFFEPDPVHFRRIQVNLASNKIDAIGLQAAMAARSGQAMFYQNKYHDMSGSLVRENWVGDIVEPIEVTTMSFGDLVVEQNLKNVCLKVDVEGGEEEFWEGAKGALESVNSMIIEMLEPAIHKKLIQRIVKHSGYHAYYINDYTLQHSISGEFTYVHPFYNWLFCRESPADLVRRLAGTNFQVIGRQ